MKRILLETPACPEDCPECNLHCAGIVMLLADLRRDQERVLRDLSHHPKRLQREELERIEEHLGSAQQAFERCRPSSAQQNRAISQRWHSTRLH